MQPKERGRITDDRNLVIGSTAIKKNLKLYTGDREHFSRLVKDGLKFYK